MPREGRKRSKALGRAILLVLIASAVAVFFLSGWYKQFTFEAVKEQRDRLKEQVDQHLLLSTVLYVGLYITLSGLSLPFSTPVSLLGGFLFDLWLGVLLVSFASTTGSTLAFLASRYLFRDFVYRRFGPWFDRVNRGLEQDGPYYLLTLRLMPIVPFFIVNLAMGLTRMPVRRFWWLSQLGMLPATILYVNAGKELGSINSPREIFTFRLMGSLALLALAPLLFRALVKWLRPAKTGFHNHVSDNGHGG
jgi:uncharacterized membrane protein YdjX (TVP38/TMEM64 family)